MSNVSKNDTERAVTPLEEARLSIQGLRYQNGVLRQCLERIAIGVTLLDRDGTMIFANRAARALLRKSSGGQTPKTTLRRSIETLAASAPLSSRSCCSIELDEEAHRVQLFVTPLINNAEGDSGIRIAFLCDAQRHISTSEELLRQLYQFTASEARLVAELVNGYSLDEAAERLNIKANTARSHLKRVFAKTQTKRQGEVVRLVTATFAALDLR